MSQEFDLGKGTVKLIAGGSTYRVSTAKVENKLNTEWNTGRVTVVGDSLPISEGDVVDLYFERDSTTIHAFNGYVNGIKELREGQQIEYDYGLFGREYFIGYRGYTPEDNVTLATDYINTLMAEIGLPTPVISGLTGDTIYIKNMRRRYISEQLKDLASDKTINYYFDQGMTLHVFTGNEDTISDSLNFFNVREANTDLTNVFNRLTLYSTERRHTDVEDYLTETQANTASWTSKETELKFINFHKLYDDPVSTLSYSDTTIHTGTISMYLDGGVQTTEYDREYYIVCDLGEELSTSTVNAINYVIKGNIDNAGNIGTSECKTELFNVYDFPPWQTETVDYLTTSNGIFTLNDEWHTMSVKLSNMSSASEEQTLQTFRYIGIYFRTKHSGYVVGGNVRLYIDNLYLTTNYSYTYTDTASTTSFGMREYIPESYMYPAKTATELQNHTQEMLADKVDKEESLRQLRFHGSLDAHVGSAVTLTFDDTVSVYTIQEILNEYDGKEWYQELKLSQSPIAVPKTKFADKIRKMDERVRYVSRYYDSIPNNIPNINFSGIRADYINAGVSEHEITYINAGSIGTISNIDYVEEMTVGSIDSIGTIGIIESIENLTVNSLGVLNTANIAYADIENIDVAGEVTIEIANVDNIGTIATLEAGILLGGDMQIQEISSVGVMSVTSATIDNINIVESMIASDLNVTNVGTVDTLYCLTEATFNAITQIDNFYALSGTINTGTFSTVNIQTATLEFAYFNEASIDTLSIQAGTIENVFFNNSTVNWANINNVGTLNINDSTINSISIGTIVTDNVVLSNNIGVGEVKTGNLAADCIRSTHILATEWIEGKKFRTASSGSRVEFSTEGIMGYSLTTQQFSISASDGRFYCGQGSIVLDKNGIGCNGGYIGLFDANTVNKANLYANATRTQIICSDDFDIDATGYTIHIKANDTEIEGDFIPSYTSQYLGNGNNYWNGITGNTIYGSVLRARSGSNTGSLGTSGWYWNRIFVNTLSFITSDPSPWDEHDDLQLANYRTYRDEEGSLRILDKDLDFLKNTEEDGNKFFDLSRFNIFLLGCAKQAGEKLRKQEEVILQLHELNNSLETRLIELEKKVAS